ncbi:MAG: NACHT domain-containing protein [Lachnospiraceae bacterium]|nr:NACHT domain-containing protein [Lachnospiraceae bacterium]
MLLILGQPGIGKSTLITWIAANFTDMTDNIFVYKFSDDLSNIEWQNTSEKYNMAYDVLLKSGLSYVDLNGKTLIIDGFDEINVHDRIVIINKLCWQLIKESPLNNFSLIITCRENYIQELHRSAFDYITLQSWNKEQIKSFCSIFQEKTKDSISDYTMANVFKNEDVFGIPLILYMVLALKFLLKKMDLS